MKKLLLAFLVTLISCSSSLAQTQVPFPEVMINGYVSFKGSTRAIIATRAGTRLVRRGQFLGDYQVVSISVRDGIAFEAFGQQFLVPWQETAPPMESTKWSSRYALRLDNAESVYVLKAIAEINDLNFYCGNEVYGGISYAGVLNPKEGLQNIISALPGVTSFQDKKMLIVGSSDTIKRVQKALTTSPPTQKRVSIDFVNAQLSFVLAGLANEMNRKVELGLEREGGVTISATRTSAYNLFLVALALQDVPYGVVSRSNVLRVVPEATYSY